MKTHMAVGEISGTSRRDAGVRADIVVMASLWALVAILLMVIVAEPHLTGAAGAC